MFTVGGALSGWEADAGGRLTAGGMAKAGVPAVRIVHGSLDALSAAAATEVFEAGAYTRPLLSST